MLEPKVTPHQKLNRPERQVQHERGCAKQPPQAVAGFDHGEAEAEKKGHSELHVGRSCWFLLRRILSAPLGV